MMSAADPAGARKLLRHRRVTGWCCLRALLIVLAGAAAWWAIVAVIRP
jgi:hypothetical protein